MVTNGGGGDWDCTKKPSVVHTYHQLVEALASPFTLPKGSKNNRVDMSANFPDRNENILKRRLFSSLWLSGCSGELEFPQEPNSGRSNRLKPAFSQTESLSSEEIFHMLGAALQTTWQERLSHSDHE